MALKNFGEDRKLFSGSMIIHNGDEDEDVENNEDLLFDEELQSN